jgi:hypothetical protein
LLIFDDEEREWNDAPSEASTQEIVPLPVIGIINADIRVKGRRRVICVETINIVFPSELRVACSGIGQLDRGTRVWRHGNGERS